MPDPRDFLPPPPWEGLPIPGVLREVLGFTGAERVTVSKEALLTFIHAVRDMGYGPTVADAKRLGAQAEPYLTEEEFDNLDVLYALWIVADNPEEARREGIYGV